MFCPNCGNQIPDGSKFCGKCGTQLSAAPAPQSAPAPQGAPAYQPAPSYPPAPGAPGAPAKKGGTGKFIALGVAALAVVGVAVWAIFTFVLGGGAGGGNGSAQAVSDGLDAALQTIIDGDFSSESLVSGVDQIIDLMPPEAIESTGYSREEIREELSSELGDIDEVSAYMSMIEMTMDSSVGAALDADELAFVNETLAEAGVTTQATEAYHLAISFEVSAMGSSESETIEESGFAAVNLGGSWYLWGSDSDMSLF